MEHRTHILWPGATTVRCATPALPSVPLLQLDSCRGAKLRLTHRWQVLMIAHRGQQDWPTEIPIQPSEACVGAKRLLEQLTPLQLSRFNWTSHTTQIHRTALFLFPSYFLSPKPMYNTDLTQKPCTIWSADLQPCTILSSGCLLYDINLGATSTTILSIGGVMIPINLVSSTTDSIRWCIVVFKPVTIPTSDPKSEFLCQSSLYCTEPTDPPNHLVFLGYLPCPRHHISPILPQPKCSNRVPEAEATPAAS